MGHWTPTGIEPTDYDDDDRVMLIEMHVNVFYTDFICRHMSAHVCVRMYVCI